MSSNNGVAVMSTKEKNAALDRLFWFRQIISLMGGVVVGVFNLQGFLVIVLFCIAAYLLSQMYSSKILNVTEEDFPNNELMMEGAGNAFGLFILTWTLAFTFL